MNRSPQQPNGAKSLDELSEREREILRLVATGASNKEIAGSLYISSNTVKVHLRNIFSKIGATSRTEAAMIAVSAGLVESGAADRISVPEAPGPVDDSLGKTRWLDQPRHRLLVISGIAIVLILAITGFWTFRLAQLSSPAAASSSLPQAQQRWKQLAPLPVARQDLGVTAYENYIYAIGGENSEGISGVTERYDPEQDAWETLTEKPTPVTEVGAAVLGGKIYVPGGRTSSGLPSNRLEVFDPSTNTWDSGPSLPLTVSAYALATFEGKLYLFGGWDGENYLNQVFLFDPTDQTWSQGTPMPTARGFSGAVTAGGKIYVLGGYDGKRALAVNEVYLPGREGTGENPWSQAQKLPDARYAMGTCNVADIVHVLGGVSEKDQALEPAVYFPQEDQWIISADVLASSWSHLGVTAIETRLYALGGYWKGEISARNYSFQAIYTISLPLLVR